MDEDQTIGSALGSIRGKLDEIEDDIASFQDDVTPDSLPLMHAVAHAAFELGVFLTRFGKC